MALFNQTSHWQISVGHHAARFAGSVASPKPPPGPGFGVGVGAGADALGQGAQRVRSDGVSMFPIFSPVLACFYGLAVSAAGLPSIAFVYCRHWYFVVHVACWHARYFYFFYFDAIRTVTGIAVQSAELLS